MKIIFLLLSVCFFVSPVFAGGKTGVPTTLREIVITQPPPPLEEEEVCVWENIPTGAIQENVIVTGSSFGFFSCPVFASMGTVSYSSPSITGVALRKTCYRKEVKK